MVGLGHEFFIWFVFVTLLTRQSEGRVSIGQTLVSFVRSPVIIAIAAGLLLNVLGLGTVIAGNPVGGGLLKTLEYLAAIIVPVILIVVGYGTRLSRGGIRQVLPLVAARFVVTLALAIVMSEAVVGGLLGLDAPVRAAVFMLFILPPPFIVPIFLPRRRQQITYANNVLSLYTVLSIVTFVCYVFATSS